jgi:hypothetical protein
MDTNVKKRGVIWGGLLILLGGLLLVDQFTDLTEWVWVAALVFSGLVALGVYLSDRSDGWLLLTAYILLVIAGLVTLITLNLLPDEFVAVYVLLAIALPFLGVFLRDRSQWWALIPAYVLLAVALMDWLMEVGILTELLVPGYIMFAIAIPFFVVYSFNTKQWWALIPGGILTIIGGTAIFIAGAAVQYIGAILLVIAGLWILIRTFTRKEVAEPEASTAVPEVEEQSNE